MDKLQLLLKFTKEFIILILFSIIFFVAIRYIGHTGYGYIWASILVVFSISKIYILISNTFKKLDLLIVDNHSFKHLLFLLSIVISVVILSFTIDYLCISELYTNAFNGIDYSQSLTNRFINLFYFTIVTFTSVGYGDITPVSAIAKILTVLEMMTAFVIIIFIISKYTTKNN